MRRALNDKCQKNKVYPHLFEMSVLWMEKVGDIGHTHLTLSAF